MKVERLTKSLIERSDIRKKGWRILILFISLYRLWMIDLVGETDRRQSAVLNKTDESGIVVWRRINVTLGRSKLDADSIGCNPQFFKSKILWNNLPRAAIGQVASERKNIFQTANELVSSFGISYDDSLVRKLHRLFEWGPFVWKLKWLEVPNVVIVKALVLAGDIKPKNRAIFSVISALSPSARWIHRQCSLVLYRPLHTISLVVKIKVLYDLTRVKIQWSVVCFIPLTRR